MGGLFNPARITTCAAGAATDLRRRRAMRLRRGSGRKRLKRASITHLSATILCAILNLVIADFCKAKNECKT